MNKRLRNGIAVVLLVCCLACYADNLSAKDVIYNFYQSYLAYDQENRGNSNAPQLVFSKAFNQDSKQNDDLCQHFSDEICGWAADGDIYLNSQEYDNHLNMSNTGFQISQAADGLINVSLNVMPSDKTGADKRFISYKMVYEDNHWVVDDIIYDRKDSVRDEMVKENEEMQQRIKDNN